MIEPSTTIPKLDGRVLRGGEQEAFLLWVPVDPIYGAGVGGNDSFLGGPTVARRYVPENDVPVAGPAGEEVAGGVLDTPMWCMCVCVCVREREAVRNNATKRKMLGNGPPLCII